MNKDDFFKNLNGSKFLEGLPEQATEWGQVFQIRRKGDLFYISMKNGPWMVEGTEWYVEWIDARNYLKKHWRQLYDNEFEKVVLGGEDGSEGS